MPLGAQGGPRGRCGEYLARLTKELLRVLVNGIRVVSLVDIRPAYRVRESEVRILEDLVELQGLEPWTSCMPCRRSSS